MSVSKKSNITLQKTLATTFECSTISPLDVDTFVISATNHPRPVRTITIQDREGDIRHRHLPDKTYTIHKSACAYILSTKTLVFVDTSQQTVYMCDITSRDGHVINTDNIRSPRGVCAGPAGTVFVCSGDTHSIVQLSREGQVLMTHEVDMFFPRALSLSMDGTHLVVSNSHEDNVMIKLFKISS